MTHIQELFIRNLRYLRRKKGNSQLAFSEKIAISPNYLNAVENGKNFPSPEVIQTIADALGVLPYQLFLEQPTESAGIKPAKKAALVQELVNIKQQLVKQIDTIIEKYDS
ncbi:MAG: helix-turn-helix domain-containing protein [Treponema sp.]|jgi:transcriptional regulator with XRE-family HTH domain|nr:helix-turn-helix domain-containing protein [Treponema sp.]